MSKAPAPVLARIKTDYEDLLPCQETDPGVFLRKARRLTEEICRRILEWELHQPLKPMTFHRLIKRLRAEQLVPGHIVTLLYNIKGYGNIGSHPATDPDLIITPEFVRPCLDSLSQVIEWLEQHYYLPQNERHQQRRIDAALPTTAALGQAFDLLVQVRFPHSPLLGSEEWPTPQIPTRIIRQEKRVLLRFPVDQASGIVGPLPIYVRLIAPACTLLSSAEKLVEVLPDQRSEVVVFQIVPAQPGLAQIQVELYTQAENRYLGTLPLATEVSQLPALSPTSGTVNITFNITISAEQAGLVQQNQDLLVLLIRQALTTTAPEQAAATEDLILPLLQMQAEGEMPAPVRGPANIPGAFGSSDLLVTLLVPLVVELLRRALTAAGAENLDAVTSDPARQAAFLETLTRISDEELRVYLQQHGLDAGKREWPHLVHTVKHLLQTALTSK